MFFHLEQHFLFLHVKPPATWKENNFITSSPSFPYTDKSGFPSSCLLQKATSTLMSLGGSSRLSSAALTPALGHKACTGPPVQCHQTGDSSSLPTQGRCLMGLLATPLCLRNGILKGLIPFSVESQLKFPLITEMCVLDLINLVARCQEW